MDARKLLPRRYRRLLSSKQADWRSLVRASVALDLCALPDAALADVAALVAAHIKRVS